MKLQINPYVKVTVGSKSCQTSCKDGAGTQAEWEGEVLRLEAVPQAAFGRMLPLEGLIVEVWNENSPAPDTLIGRSTLAQESDDISALFVQEPGDVSRPVAKRSIELVLRNESLLNKSTGVVRLDLNIEPQDDNETNVYLQVHLRHAGPGAAILGSINLRTPHLLSVLGTKSQWDLGLDDADSRVAASSLSMLVTLETATRTINRLTHYHYIYTNSNT